MEMAMTESEHIPWVRYLDDVSSELRRLYIACDLRLRDPGVVERIGPDETKKIIDAITERLDRTRAIGSTGPKP
jgi:hypothetical protein